MLSAGYGGRESFQAVGEGDRQEGVDAEVFQAGSAGQCRLRCRVRRRWFAGGFGGGRRRGAWAPGPSFSELGVEGGRAVEAGGVAVPVAGDDGGMGRAGGEQAVEGFDAVVGLDLFDAEVAPEGVAAGAGRGGHAGLSQGPQLMATAGRPSARRRSTRASRKALAAV